MKKFCLFILGLLVILPVFSQNEGHNVYYGVNLSQFHTGSGHGSSYVINTNIRRGRKALDFGMVYQGADKRISGGDVKYKVFMGKNAFLESQQEEHGISVKPYIHYNCIYQSSRVVTPDVAPTGMKKSTYPELPSSPGTIASMEHYAGLGIQVFLAKNICLTKRKQIKRTRL